MRALVVCTVAVLCLLGCSSSSDTGDSAVVNGAKSQSNTQAPPQATADQQQQASAAQQMLVSLGVPLYPGATVDATQHSSSDPQSVNAVFTTSATTKQVDYFYEGYPELKSQSTNGSTVFAGSLNKVPVVIEVRAAKGQTEIVAQARKAQDG
jgi:hypothetical protein